MIGISLSSVPGLESGLIFVPQTRSLANDFRAQFSMCRWIGVRLIRASIAMVGQDLIDPVIARRAWRWILEIIAKLTYVLRLVDHADAA